MGRGSPETRVRYIAVLGTMGVGKSTLLRWCARDYRYNLTALEDLTESIARQQHELGEGYCPMKNPTLAGEISFALCQRLGDIRRGAYGDTVVEVGGPLALLADIDSITPALCPEMRAAYSAVSAYTLGTIRECIPALDATVVFIDTDPIVGVERASYSAQKRTKYLATGLFDQVPELYPGFPDPSGLPKQQEWRRKAIDTLHDEIPYEKVRIWNTDSGERKFIASLEQTLEPLLSRKRKRR